MFFRSESKSLNTSVDPGVVFVIGRTGEGPVAAWLGAVVRLLAGVCAHVHLANVGGPKRPPAAFIRTKEGLFSRKVQVQLHSLI